MMFKSNKLCFFHQNKSLKNKLLSGSKLCGIHAEESKKIQAQLKELRYGKKDLLFKAQQLTDLERKLAVAKNELEKAALDRDSQLKAMKETVHLCLSTVFRNQPPPLSLMRPNPAQLPILPGTVGPVIPDASSKFQAQQTFPGRNESSHVETTKEENPNTTENAILKMFYKMAGPAQQKPVTAPKKLQMPPCTECEVKKNPEKQLTNFEGRATREEKIL
uniref:leucine zipper protein 2 n=1 Tax=Halichoerus grypus TaxID=9711 RepID=UPI001659C6C3|nr:leucine zipper protein 2 [Halichoerus grypus]